MSIPNVSPFVLTSELTPVGSFVSSVNIDSEFTWTPSNDTDSYITLSTDENFGSNTLEGDGRVVINCVLADDGSFSFSEDVQNQLSEFGLTTLFLAIGRENIAFFRQDDTIVGIIRESGIEP